MKTFTAEEFNKSPQEVYREADRNGEVRINHGHYHDRIFILTSKKRGANLNIVDLKNASE